MGLGPGAKAEETIVEPFDEEDGIGHVVQGGSPHDSHARWCPRTPRSLLCSKDFLLTATGWMPSTPLDQEKDGGKAIRM